MSFLHAFLHSCCFENLYFEYNIYLIKANIKKKMFEVKVSTVYHSNVNSKMIILYLK